MAERKGQVYGDKWAALVQLGWVLEASEHYPGNHGILGSAELSLERIRRLFGNLLSFAWRWSVNLVASLYFFYSGRYLLLQKAKNCRLNERGWTRMNVSALLNETRSVLSYNSRIWIWCVIFSWSDALPKDQKLLVDKMDKNNTEAHSLCAAFSITYSYNLYQNYLDPLTHSLTLTYRTKKSTMIKDIRGQ